MGRLSSIIAECYEENVCIIGDLNAAPTSARFNEVLSLCDDNSMKVCDTLMLDSNTYTHLNQGSLTRSWLDHCIVSEALLESIGDCNTGSDFSTSDHCTLNVSFKLNFLPSLCDETEDARSIKWKFSDCSAKERFTDFLERSLRELNLQITGNGCIRPGCSKVSHTSCITEVCNTVDRTIITSGRRIFGTKKKAYREVFGWSQHVKMHYNEYRSAFLEWRKSGSPREGPLASSMRRLCPLFKLALRRCRQNEENIKAEAACRKVKLQKHKRVLE